MPKRRISVKEYLEWLEDIKAMAYVEGISKSGKHGISVKNLEGFYYG